LKNAYFFNFDLNSLLLSWSLYWVFLGKRKAPKHFIFPKFLLVQVSCATSVLRQTPFEIGIWVLQIVLTQLITLIKKIIIRKQLKSFSDKRREINSQCTAQCTGWKNTVKMTLFSNLKSVNSRFKYENSDVTFLEQFYFFSKFDI
jgi:hypothetical protein